MATNYPKFNQKINDMVTASDMQKQKTRFGVIASYDKNTNTAKVMLEDRFSDQLTDILSGVPCPLNQGIQTVAPEVGARCVVGFRDQNERMPFIISFYATQADNTPLFYNKYASTHVPRYLI